MAVAYVEPVAAPSPAGVDPALAALVRAVDGVLAADVAALSDAMARERQRTLLVQIERLRTGALRGLRTIDTRQIYTDDGAGRAAAWLRGQAVADDRLCVHTARRLDAMPVAAAEASAGRLSVRDLQTIASALGRVPEDVDEKLLRAVICDGAGYILRGVLGADEVAISAACAQLDAISEAAGAPHDRLERAFVLIAQAMAERLPGSSLRIVLADLVDALLPAEHDERAARKHSVRHLVLRPVFDGGWHLRGFLDDDTGALLRSSLERFAPAEPEEDQPGTEKPSREQQAHDALHAALTHLLGARPAVRLASQEHSEERNPDEPGGAGSSPAPTVALTLIGQAEALLRAPGALPARLGDLMRVAPATLERLACGSMMTGVLLDGSGRVVHVGRARRHATPAQRLALQAQWGGLCAVAGCGRPATIPHHVVWWHHGGGTDLHNLVPLCHHNHHDIHTGRKTLRLRDGRWIGPDGWVDGPSP